MIDDAIVVHEWDIAAVAPERRRDAYLAEIDHALATTFLDGPIEAHLKSYLVGPLRIIELEASPRRSERTPALIARDRHDGISVQLVTAGSATGEAAGRPVASMPGTIMLLDFAQPFVIADQAPRHVINVAIPRALLVPHFDDVRTLHGTVLDSGAGGLLAAYLRELLPRLDAMPAYAAPVIGDVVVKLLVLALGHDPSRRRLPDGNRRHALFDRARRLIDGRLGSADLTPEWLAGKLNVSRSELYNAFDTEGGIARFIVRRRLEGAHTALGDRHDLRRIGEIAFAYGFSSEAHFARAYRSAFGCTASETRRASVPLRDGNAMPSAFSFHESMNDQ